MASDGGFHSDTVSRHQPTSATARLLMSDHATAVDQANASRSPAASALAGDPMLLPDAMAQDDLSATAMSIDTPSYARSLAMGQLGYPAGGSAPFGVSQSLCEAMSIDGQQQMPFWDSAAANTSGEHICTFLSPSDQSALPEAEASADFVQVQAYEPLLMVQLKEPPNNRRQITFSIKLDQA